MEGYITHVVSVGDSLQKIAIQYGLDDWREIAYINNLNYPYINDDVTAQRVSEDGTTSVGQIDASGIAKIGDQLLIPNWNYTTTPTYNQITAKKLEKLAYGCDISIYTYEQPGVVVDLQQKGELVEDGYGDLDIAEGVANIRQSLLIELNTPRGALLLHPDFGSDIKKRIGMKASKSNLIKIQLEAQRVILKNFRVKSIRNMEVTQDGGSGACRIKCEIEPISPYSVFTFNELISSSI